MIEIKDDKSGDAYGGEESVGASVIASRNTAPILDFLGHSFDLVAPAVVRRTTAWRPCDRSSGPR